MLDLRPATLDDMPAVVELLGARESADFGQSNITEALLRGWWAEEPDAIRWLAWLEGRCAGYARLFDDGAVAAEVHDESCTHPELEGRGVGSALFDRLEEQAREKAFLEIRATAWTETGRAFLHDRGYRYLESFWRMEAELTDAPPSPRPPAGYVLDGYREHEDDEALYACATAAGGDWAGAASLELWRRQRHSRADYDPRGWAVARVAGGIAGGVLAFPLAGNAWILDVFVAPEHQHRGLGEALMLDCFRRLRDLGCTHAGLEVDAQNAIRLYERVGMRVTRRYDVHEKAL